VFKIGLPDGSTEAPYFRRVFRHLVLRARIAQDEKRYADAATLYGEALRLSPRRANLHVQRGHMLKEAGQLEQAEHHYLEALRLTPDDANLHFQLGHFYKVAARIADAQRHYQQAARLKPEWEAPAHELDFLHRSGWRGQFKEPADAQEFDVAAGSSRRPEGFDGLTPGQIARLVPSLAPRQPEDLRYTHDERIDIRRLGRHEVGFWGVRRTLRGVEAIRGFCISSTPLVDVQVVLNGVAIHRAPLKGGYSLKYEEDEERARKYVFNIWLDFSDFAYGQHTFELRFFDPGGATRSFHELVVVAEPVPEAAYPDSDALVEVSRQDPRPLEQQIRSRPSMVRPAARSLFPHGVRNVLAMRTDQLGDMISSIPAMQRLREILSDAHIVGLLTSANAEFARTLGLFDEVIVVDFPDDELHRRRIMPLEVQEALRQRLAPYAFDIALDLAQSNVSRDLLQLSGAKFIYGTGGGRWPWLSADLVFNTHDPWNSLDMVPHSAKVMALVEGLGVILKSHAPIIRRTDLSRERLEPYGLAAHDRYAILHTGARIAFSRWPHYGTVAAMLLERTDLKVVMMADAPSSRPSLPAELLAHPRFVLVERRLPFDDFDAFLSFATVVAGNDSGPKHLAALRGVNVVTLFTARINWSEWGQENVGLIISRRVPCAGCAIFHENEECGKDFACVLDIRPEEVVEAMMAFIGEPACEPV
jgi:ADP-heptose:LPS heptosyltransferase